jgi:transposase
MARVEIFHERARRRWTEADKRRLVAETVAPGETVHGVARRHGVNTSQLFTWRKRFRIDLAAPAATPAVPGFAAVALVPSTPPPSAGVTKAAFGLPTSSGLIEIELPGGERVRISGAADPATVAAALRALLGR